MRKNGGVCYLCGEPGADTVEHVVPRGFFPDGLPPDPPKAPAHRACNNATTKEEEGLRNLIALGTRREGNAGDQKLFDTAVRALSRPEAARYRDDFFRRMQRTPEGGIIGMREGHGVYALAKICKGLAFLNGGLLLSPKQVWWGARGLSPSLKLETPQPQYVTRVPPVLEMAWWSHKEFPLFALVHFLGRAVYSVVALPPSRILTRRAWDGKTLHWPRR